MTVRDSTGRADYSQAGVDRADQRYSATWILEPSDTILFNTKVASFVSTRRRGKSALKASRTAFLALWGALTHPKDFAEEIFWHVCSFALDKSSTFL